MARVSKKTVAAEKPAPVVSQKTGKTRSIKVKKTHVAVALLVLFIIAGVVGGYFVYDKQQKEISRLSDPQQSAKVESDKIKEQVSALIELPGNEDPTIATVVDSGKLKSQAFFAKAENGDRVLMYAQAKKAILYRPSSDKIVEVAPINVGDAAGSAATQQPAAASTQQQVVEQPGVTTQP